MQAVKKTLAEILRIEGNLEHYHVPKYQREYAWRTSNWEQLLQDIREDDEHFMGSLICVYDADEAWRPNDERIYEVVDGQQRLTTVSLLLMAIYAKYRVLQEGGDEMDEDEIQGISQTLFSLRQKLIKKKKKEDSYADERGGFVDGKMTCFLRVQPSTQSKNLEDFKFLLKDELCLIGSAEKQKHAGNRAITKAFRYFLSAIPDDKGGLDELIERVNRLTFVHISVNSQANAFMLFESLNNRGVPLSALDIIKNKMLSAMEGKHGVDIDDSYKTWQLMLENLPDAAVQERFLRQYYNAFKIDDKIRIEKFPRATASTLIAIFEALIKRDAAVLFDDLVAKAEIYNRFVQPSDWEEVDAALAEKLLELQRIGGTASYTFLLYLLSLEKGDVAKGAAVEIVDFLCRYSVRRNVTDTPATRSLDAIFTDTIEKCDKRIKSGQTLTVDFVRKTIIGHTDKPASDEMFREHLSVNLYDRNALMARYLLVTLDSSFHSREYAPDLWAKNESDKYVWTIEHVLPQGDHIPKVWVDMIADGDEDEAGEVQNRVGDCLGNLTLSAYNSKLSNHSFERKQKKTSANVFGQRISIGYTNGLALNNLEFKVGRSKTSLANAETWDEMHIATRNDAIVDQLCKMFDL